MDALVLYEKALEIDREAENPHYQLHLARAAHSVGKSEVARQHLAIFEEMLQTKKAISLTYARMHALAEEITHAATVSGQDSRQYRSGLEEADALYLAVAIGRQRTGDIPGVCTALLGRAEIARMLNDTRQLHILARTVELLAAKRSERFVAKANRLSVKAAVQLSASEVMRLNRAAGEEVAAIERDLPAPLVVPSAP